MIDSKVDDRHFREQVRDFLRSHLPEELVRQQKLTTTVVTEPEVSLAWQRILHRHGLAAPMWPVEHGGQPWSPSQLYIFEDECARAGAPSIAGNGVRMLAPLLMRYGSPEQKAFYLPRLLSTEDYWCQGYSEPGAGSDLASLKTRAVKDGDSYVVNGTKIWTTHAHLANRMFALVRTSDTGRKQQGITFLLIDMDTPGITVRPIRTIGGEHEVNQVFFDDVRVPQSNRVGEEGGGWGYGKYLLEFERGNVPGSGKLRRLLGNILEQARSVHDGEAMKDPIIAAAIAQTMIDIECLSACEQRVLAAVQSGVSPGALGSLLKYRISHLQQDVTRIGMSVIGSDALAWEEQRPLWEIDGTSAVSEGTLPLLPRYLNARAYTIFGGAAEVQREIMAKTLCGL